MFAKKGDWIITIYIFCYAKMIKKVIIIRKICEWSDMYVEVRKSF